MLKQDPPYTNGERNQGLETLKKDPETGKYETEEDYHLTAFLDKVQVIPNFGYACVTGYTMYYTNYNCLNSLKPTYFIRIIQTWLVVSLILAFYKAMKRTVGYQNEE